MLKILKRLENLEKQMVALASRPYTQRSEEAKAEAMKAQGEIQTVNDAVADVDIALADFMEQYYLDQLGLEKGE